METPVTRVWKEDPKIHGAMHNLCMQRFADHADTRKLSKSTALLIGCGSVGSWVGIAVAKMGVPLWKLIDFDEVEIHNTANQLWGPGYIGEKKVFCMQDFMSKAASVAYISANDKRFEPKDTQKANIVLACVDSITVRKEIYDDVKENNPDCTLFFDARTGGGRIKVFAFNPQDEEQCKRYEKTLHSKELSTETRCTDIGGVTAPMFAAAAATSACIKYSKDLLSFSQIIGNMGEDIDLLVNNMGRIQMTPSQDKITEPVTSNVTPEMAKKLKLSLV